MTGVPSSVTICSVCGVKYSVAKNKECPTCAAADNWKFDDRTSLIVPDDYSSDEEWLQQYRLTFGKMSNEELMQCEANGVNPQFELIDRRFKILMSMLMETRGMLEELRTKI